MFARGPLVSEPIERDAEPVMNIALVREQMSGFTEIFRRGQSVLELPARRGMVPLCQRPSAEREPGANMLAEGLTFAAFPGLKLSGRQNVQCPLRLAGLIVKRSEFDAQIVALRDQGWMFFQFAQAFRRRIAESLP